MMLPSMRHLLYYEETSRIDRMSAVNNKDQGHLTTGAAVLKCSYIYRNVSTLKPMET
jgi:hypothetical protein